MTWVMPKLHVIALPHTIVSNEFSHCAFTGKVLRFSKMMRAYGWTVYEYSNEGSESEASKHVQVLSTAEFAALSRRTSDSHFYTADINNQELTETFYTRTQALLQEHTKKHDIVCHVFGPMRRFIPFAPECFHVESGVGYTCHTGLVYRIFESEIWKAWHAGRNHDAGGSNVHWVAPNYYDLAEWDVGPGGNSIVFLGRIQADKGLRTIVEIARRCPMERFILCGQGDPTPWLTEPNIEYKPPVKGLERSKLLGSAKAVLCPTEFLEPFCGVNVEAQLCGTPVISTDFGAFVETIDHGVTGYRCHMLQDYVEAVHLAPMLDRSYIADRARALYSLEAVGARYDSIFNQISEQAREGWYSRVSFLRRSEARSPARRRRYCGSRARVAVSRRGRPRRQQVSKPE